MGEEILLTQQHWLIEVKFSYSPLGEKQIEVLKSVESSNKKSPSVKTFIVERMLNPKIISELRNIIKLGQKNWQKINALQWLQN